MQTLLVHRLARMMHQLVQDKENLLNDEKKLVKILDVNEDNTLKILCDNKEMNINSGEVTFHLN